MICPSLTELSESVCCVVGHLLAMAENIVVIEDCYFGDKKEQK